MSVAAPWHWRGAGERCWLALAGRGCDRSVQEGDGRGKELAERAAAFSGGRAGAQQPSSVPSPPQQKSLWRSETHEEERERMMEGFQGSGGSLCVAPPLCQMGWQAERGSTRM